MHYIKITKFDTSNGPGIRTVLWVAGCEHHCKGCHNESTWNPYQGIEYTQETLEEILATLESPYISGVTFSGGDPLHPFNIIDVAVTILKIRKKYPDKSIWVYTGYNYEDLLYLRHVRPTAVRAILGSIDVLVDGKFILDKRNISLPYCGSENQRVIDMRKTIANNYKVVLYENNP